MKVSIPLNPSYIRLLFHTYYLLFAAKIRTISQSSKLFAIILLVIVIHFEDAVAHFFAEVEGLEDFDAELHQLVQEIVGGTDVEREIGVGRGGRISMSRIVVRTASLA